MCFMATTTSTTCKQAKCKSWSKLQHGNIKLSLMVLHEWPVKPKNLVLIKGSLHSNYYKHLFHFKFLRKKFRIAYLRFQLFTGCTILNICGVIRLPYCSAMKKAIEKWESCNCNMSKWQSPWNLKTKVSNCNICSFQIQLLSLKYFKQIWL